MAATRTFSVTGMTCDHCRNAITEEVGSVPGVTGVDVDLATGLVTVNGEADAASVRTAITDVGYEVAPD